MVWHHECACDWVCGSMGRTLITQLHFKITTAHTLVANDAIIYCLSKCIEVHSLSGTCNCYFKRLTLMDKTRLATRTSFNSKNRQSDRIPSGWVTNSPCLSCHEDVYIFQCQQATIFTATLLFQPQLIRTMYIQLQIIKHRNLQFVVLHRHYFIHDIFVRCKKSS